MGRQQAEDHHLKREAILEGAARAFAEGGFVGTSMNAIAAACGVSKALLYHYYESKEAILDDILSTHLARLVEVAEAVDPAARPPREHLEALSAALLDAYRDSDAHHRVQLNDLDRLPAERQEAMRALERRLVAVFAAAIAAVHPHLAERRDVLKPLTMSLFGMLNWQYLWFREGGAMSRADYARLATRLVVEGAPGPGGLRGLGEERDGADMPGMAASAADPGDANGTHGGGGTRGTAAGERAAEECG
jgi:TetR/AcrR family transcriptional regulator